MSNSVSFEPIITAKQAANFLGLHVNTLRAWVRAGKIPVIRLGLCRLGFRISHLNDWLEQNYNGAAVHAA